MDYGNIRGTVRLSLAGPIQTLADVLERAHMDDSVSQSRRLIAQGAVTVNGVRQTDPWATLSVPGTYEIHVGKSHHATVILEEPS